MVGHVPVPAETTVTPKRGEQVPAYEKNRDAYAEGNLNPPDPFIRILF